MDPILDNARTGLLHEHGLGHHPAPLLCRCGKHAHRLIIARVEASKPMQSLKRYPVNAGMAATHEDFAWSSAGPIDNRPQGNNLVNNLVNNLPHK